MNHDIVSLDNDTKFIRILSKHINSFIVISRGGENRERALGLVFVISHTMCLNTVHWQKMRNEINIAFFQAERKNNVALVGVMSHELGHVLGMPDIPYDTKCPSGSCVMNQYLR